MYKRNIEARSLNYCRRIKAIIITYFECLSVALVIQHARHDFRDRFIENEMCMF